MNMIIAQIWRRRCKMFKAYPKYYDNIYTNKMRYMFTFTTSLLYPSYEIHFYSGQLLKTFILDNGQNMEFKVKLRKFFDLIAYIQKKATAQTSTREAKVDILVNYWDKMIGQLQTRASELRDRKATALCGQIIIVSKCVQRAVLREWVDRCQELHAIAFL